MKLPIYMDYHATTPIDKRVLEAMMPTLTTTFGNASSKTHSFGWEAEALVEQAREQVARLINAEPREIYFTSGATESNNLAIKGAAEVYVSKGDHIVTVATEHKAVLDPCERLERGGSVRVTVLPVGKDGLLDLDALRKAITDKTILVSVMAANNEIGVLQPIAKIGKICKDREVLFHCDAVQALGRVPIDVKAMGIDILSISAHKIYGPKGIGAIYIRRRSPRVRLAPLLDGGGHEHGMRSGTLNVPGIVGLGKAAEIARELLPEESPRIRTLRDRLLAGLTKQLDEITINGSLEHRLPNNLNVTFRFVDGESLLMSLHDVALSSGSACMTEDPEPSHVLKALGLSEELCKSSIRFGLGRFNTEEEVKFVIGRVVESVEKLRSMSPRYNDAGKARGPGSGPWIAH
ncbi:MAG: IscS subfamily cysteine desulfurase [bacterium]